MANEKSACSTVQVISSVNLNDQQITHQIGKIVSSFRNTGLFSEGENAILFCSTDFEFGCKVGKLLAHGEWLRPDFSAFDV